jgi:RimJ/RimL family protein N-acetyltransferase
MNILVNEQVRLTEFRDSDKPALIEHLQEKEIFDRTLRIPYPYTEKDAEEWLGIVAKTTQQQGCPVQWAIRNANDYLIGGTGFDGFQVGKSHRAEIGYWLAKPYWNRGIMSAVVQRVCQYAFEKFGLVKITAHVFTTNPASARVLIKCGFEQEGFLKKHYVKGEQYLDAKLYSLLR